MKITPELLGYTYQVLKRTAFYDVEFPRGIKFKVGRLKKDDGWYWNDHLIVISKYINTPKALLMAMSHELTHAALEKSGGDHYDHGPDFQALAAIICKRMGWCAKEF